MYRLIVVGVSWLTATAWVAYGMRGESVISRAKAESARRQALEQEPNDLPSMIHLIRVTGLVRIAKVVVMGGLVMWGAVTTM